MKSLPFCILLFVLLSFGCSENEDSSPTPFSLLPEGLQKNIEAEVIQEMEEEAIDYMEAQNRYYHFPVPGCALIDDRNWLRLQKVSNDELRIRGEVEQIESIRKKVFIFYTANEHLSSDQTDKYMQKREYEFYNYPFYSTISPDQLKMEIERSQKYLDEAVKENSADLIKFYKEYLKEWEDKLTTLNTLNVETLKEIQINTHITVNDKTQDSGFSSLTIEALQGMLDVRNWAAKIYFDESYLSLYFKATRYYDEKANRKIQAINNLYKINISDHSYADSKDLLWGWNSEAPQQIAE
jgi:hypothetical protein